MGKDPATNAARVAAFLADTQPQEYFPIDAKCRFNVKTALRTLQFPPEGLEIALRDLERDLVRTPTGKRPIPCR